MRRSLLPARFARLNSGGIALAIAQRTVDVARSGRKTVYRNVPSAGPAPRRPARVNRRKALLGTIAREVRIMAADCAVQRSRGPVGGSPFPAFTPLSH